MVHSESEFFHERMKPSFDAPDEISHRRFADSSNPLLDFPKRLPSFDYFRSQERPLGERRDEIASRKEKIVTVGMLFV